VSIISQEYSIVIHHLDLERQIVL